MAFCPNCGSEVQGRFCAKCGAPAGAAPPPQQQQGPAGDRYTPPPGTPPPGNPYQAPYQAQAPGPQAAGLEENVACALCYLLGILTGVLFLVLEPYSKNRNIRFHAFQSIFLGVATIAGWIVLGILSPLLALGGLLLVLLTIYPFAVIALYLVLMYKAYSNERLVLPVIGPMAEKQA